MMNTPQQIAPLVVETGKAKTSYPATKMLLLGMLAGIFISFGAVGANTVAATITNPSFSRLCQALVFPVGLSLVLIAGSELFTGNALIAVGVFHKEIPVIKMIKNWFFVYVGNFIGSIIAAVLCFGANQFSLFNNAVAVNTIAVAQSKCSIDFVAGMCSGILCNIIVCIAVWMSYAAKSAGGKISVVYLPIVAFVLAGFEHSVANMYYITAGLLAKTNPVYLQAALDAGKQVNNITMGGFLGGNLLPVTIGNIIGGLFVAFMYQVIYLKNEK